MKQLILVFLLLVSSISYTYADTGNVVKEFKTTKTGERLDNFFGVGKRSYSVKVLISGKIEEKTDWKSKLFEGKKYEIFVKVDSEKSKAFKVSPNNEFKTEFIVDSVQLTENERFSVSLLHDDLINKTIVEKDFIFDDDDFEFENNNVEVEIEFFPIGD